MSRSISFAMIIALQLSATACAASPRQSPAPVVPAVTAAAAVAVSDTTRMDTTFVMPDITKFTRASSGLMYYDVVTGSGTIASDLREVDVHYTGMLEDRSIFDSSARRGRPIRFVLGRGRVIRGWELGILGMRQGGRRVLIVPPDMAYGATGMPPDIPANATLIFDIRLVGVR